MSDWYYAANNEQKGPVNEAELKENLAANKLPADTLVWKDGMDNWTPASQVPAFTFRAPPIPAKVQPPTMATTPAVKVVAATPLVNNPQSVQPVEMSTLMGTPEALEVETEDADKNKIFGILAYLSILFIVPLLAAKDSAFARYHANQGLVLFLFEIALGITNNVLSVVFGMVGLGFLSLILSLLYVAPLILLILGVVNAAAGKCVPLPLIGGVKLIK